MNMLALVKLVFMESKTQDLFISQVTSISIPRMESFKEIPGMLALVEGLKEAGYRVAMLSNISADIAMLVREIGFYKPFDPVVLSCDINAKKPDVKAYHILLKRLGCAPDKCLFIDDRERNIQAAKKVGIDGLVFLYPDKLKRQLKEKGVFWTEKGAAREVSLTK